ncbi:MAG: hypothetical protein O3B01_21920 [Planctomycetota bacterium]|nr:hypothetical protein [Planctomycetota bacterium]MDA1141229.1 hypothetical protein [Planctomycetota bacterium]
MNYSLKRRVLLPALPATCHWITVDMEAARYISTGLANLQSFTKGRRTLC